MCCFESIRIIDIVNCLFKHTKETTDFFIDSAFGGSDDATIAALREQSTAVVDDVADTSTTSASTTNAEHERRRAHHAERATRRRARDDDSSDWTDGSRANDADDGATSFDASRWGLGDVVARLAAIARQTSAQREHAELEANVLQTALHFQHRIKVI